MGDDKVEEGTRRQILASLFPLAAFALQSVFWTAFQPFVWILFYPAVFFSSWLGGKRAGLAATAFSTIVVWWFFIPRRYTFALERPWSGLSIVIFAGMGVLFSFTHDRLRVANQRTATALSAVKEARDHLEDQVSERTGELLRAKKEWERTFDSVPDLIAIIDAQYRIVRANRAMTERLGVTQEECVGRSCFQCIHGALESRELCPHALTLNDGREHQAEVHEDRLGGDFLVTTTPLLDDHGVMLGTVHVARDITERKRAQTEILRLNADLAARAVALETANRDLEAFNYTVAHDLRQPLNVVSSYCQAIEMLFGDQIQKECRDYIQGAYNGTRRMNQLIEALLNFSRLAHAEPGRETVDITAQAREVAEDLKLVESGRQVDFRCADGITAVGDAELLRTVLANLLGNAWKYTGTRENAVIEFGVTAVDGKPAYFVRDNGLGFEKADAGKLFVPFQRLMGVEEFRGFGIGLATVERIIQRHGGKVWAEGEPGQGATFYFTLG